MTNTAIRRKVLKKRAFLKDRRVIAYDWWMFTSLLDQGLKAKVIQEPVCSYRIKENNTLGWGADYNVKRFKKEMLIIDAHLSLLKPNKYRQIAKGLVLEAKSLINKFDTLDNIKLTNNNIWYYDFFRNVLRLRKN